MEVAKEVAAMRRVSLKHLWVLTVLAGIFIFLNLNPIRPHDFWWHMAVGREIVVQRQLPTTDAYSYTMPGQLYPSYQMFWLMDIVLYLVYIYGGPALMVFFHTLVVLLAYSLVLFLALRQTGSWRIAAFAGLFAAAMGFDHWNVRPQSITFLLGALYQLAIYEIRLKKRFVWLTVFPLGMVVWVNSHGSFSIGLALLALWLIDESWQVLKAITTRKTKFVLHGVGLSGLSLGLAILACLANPRGINVVSYLLTMFTNPVIQSLVPEWGPVALNTLPGGILLGGILLTLGILILSPRRPELYELAVVVIFSVLGLKASRGIIWFGLIIAPVLARHIHAIFTVNNIAPKIVGGEKNSTLVNWVFASSLIFLAVLSLPWFKPYLPLPKAKSNLISTETPVEATRYLIGAHIPGPLFHHMPFGSYLIWAAQPDYPVFVDSRLELYPLSIWEDYLQIANAQEGWQAKLDHYGINTLMLSPQDQRDLIVAVEATGGWQKIYEDSSAVLYTRIMSRLLHMPVIP